MHAIATAPSRRRLWLRALPDAVILGTAWLVFLVYAYPGVMTIDSLDQLAEARSGFYTDSHPPAMAALWRLVEHVVAGPFGILLIQGTCLLAGMYLLLRRAMSTRAAAICAAILLLFPPICVPMTVIWKDCLMAGFLALGIAGITDKRRGVRLGALALLALATSLRYNAFAATLPAIVMLFEWRPGQRKLARYGIAVGTWVAISMFAIGCNAALADRKMYIWSSSLALADITGTLTMLDDDVPDGELGPLLAHTGIRADHDIHAAVRAHYTPGDFVKLTGPNPDELWDLPITGLTPAPEEQRDAIAHAWRTLVFGHPLAYFEYRLDSFAEVLGLRKKFAGATIILRKNQSAQLLDHYGISRDTSSFQYWLEGIMDACAKRTRLFRPHVYLVLAIALLVLARRERDVAALLLSGLVMELSLLPLAVTPDYRYSHWLVTCTCLALAMLFARRRRSV